MAEIVVTTMADEKKRQVRAKVPRGLDRQTMGVGKADHEPEDQEILAKLVYKNVSQCSLSQAQEQRPESTNQQMLDYMKDGEPQSSSSSESCLARIHLLALTT